RCARRIGEGHCLKASGSTSNQLALCVDDPAAGQSGSRASPENPTLGAQHRPVDRRILYEVEVDFGAHRPESLGHHPADEMSHHVIHHDTESSSARSSELVGKPWTGMHFGQPMGVVASHVGDSKQPFGAGGKE